jgi:hypothetical protein
VKTLRHLGISRETNAKEAALIRSMIQDLRRTIQILQIEICNEEECGRVFDKADPLYSFLARTLTCRRDNLIATVADLEKRLHDVTQVFRAPISEAA